MSENLTHEQAIDRMIAATEHIRDCERGRRLYRNRRVQILVLKNIGDRGDGGVGINDKALADSHRKHTLPAGALPNLATRRRLLRSFGVGLVHGLPGSAAIALLVLSAIPRPLCAILYLTIFCAGTIVGMALITTAIATPLTVASSRMSSLHQRFVTAAGLVSFSFGLWTPH